ncbi:diguanylate cyclase [Streptomyces sp. NP160]|uniref:histidine kinase N-terminal 7TM domain-containing diguanylate cyclase n=1 Tax=Streptomyces sp. NP160 TaxID=2586637 RepID=UPI0011192F68|nr:diguanylate cyclase [Streptomyces sp. NP160]TNM66946.1 diguanylate cyclase [Streptomyces sp. NP160]
MAWTAVLTACALCCAVAATLAWRRPERGAARTYALGSGGATLWCAAGAGLSTATDLRTVAALRLLATAGALAVAAGAYWLARTGDAPHRRPGPLDLAVLVLPPLLVLPALAANPWHQLLYTDSPGAAGSPDRWADGPLYPAVVAALGVPAGLSLVHLARGLVRSPAVYRPHLRTLLVCALAVTAGVVVSLGRTTADQHVDLVPLALAAASLVAVRGMLRREMLAVLPLVRTQVLEDLPDALLVTDARGTVVDLNASGRRLLERLAAPGAAPDPEGALGRPLADVAPFLPPLSTTTAAVGAQVSPMPGLHLDVRVSTIRTRRGVVAGRAVLLRDVSEVVERRLAAESTSRRLADEAVRDPLTGLLNRRGLHAAAAALPPGAPLAVVIVDVDHFKAVNDTHGHDAGDAVLLVLSAVLADAAVEHLPDGACASRLGGEEFALLLPGLDAPAATAVAERVLAGVRAASAQSPLTAAVIRVTASAGVAAAVGRPASSLMRDADAALYTAKRAGRDRVVLSGDGAVDGAVAGAVA